MQTIITKYHGPVNVKGARISAVNSGKSKRVYVPYDHALCIDGNHAQAARIAREALGWTKVKGYPPMHAGSLPDGSTVWVFCSPYMHETQKIDN